MERRVEQCAQEEAFRERLKPQQSEAEPLQGGSSALASAPTPTMPEECPEQSTTAGAVAGASSVQLGEMMQQFEEVKTNQAEMKQGQAEMMRQLQAILQENPSRRSGLHVCFPSPPDKAQ